MPETRPGPAATLRSRLAAGIVLFEPDPVILRRLIDAVRPHAGEIIIFVNQLTDLDLRIALTASQGIVLVESTANVGVGEALNRIAWDAVKKGYSQLILFDQDSRPCDHLASDLVSIFDRLDAEGHRPAVVGPSLVAPEAGSYKAPRYFRQGRRDEGRSVQSVRFLPTSGSLISLSAFRAIGPFRSDYFIDAIDIEWCFRAWARGYSCWRATETAMEHTVGEGALGTKTFGLQTPRQRDFRLETYVRNNVYGFRLPHIPLSWKLRQAAYILLQIAAIAAVNRFRPSLMKRLGRGLVNGLRGRLGPPEGVPFA